MILSVSSTSDAARTVMILQEMYSLPTVVVHCVLYPGRADISVLGWMNVSILVHSLTPVALFGLIPFVYTTPSLQSSTCRKCHFGV